MTADDAVARVRAADPASGAEPNTATLRRTVDERISAAPPVDELAVRRARRWASWPARVASVAAAALVVGGGGGYAIGAAGGGSESPAQAPIALQGPMQGAGADRATEEGVQSDMAYWPGYWGGRTVFTASGLSDAGGSAEAWAFDPAQSFSAETVADLAAALGVDGTPVEDEWTWRVGPNDGTAPTVLVMADGTSSVSYHDPTKDPWRCEPIAVPEDDALREREEVDPSFGAGTLPAPDPCTEQDLGSAPTGDAAIAALRDTLSAIGLDPADYRYAADDYGDDVMAYVTATHVVDEQQTGLAWWASFTGAGLQSLQGSLAPLSSLGEYEVISPTAAVLRLSDPRFGAAGGGYLRDDRGGDVMMDEAVPAPLAQSVPVRVSAGAPIGWPVAQVTITEARLGVALHNQPDGAALLVPSYELTSSDGRVWSVIAVADSKLDFSAER